ncbi:YraN family protein [Acidimangrovimonas pyrenivorans]|uniref:UPF0102 protein ACFOES_18695 n=1 Tax=Acidimangrovimonas pyrenivorans TaxID=2030798 RepID=A0ABV7AMB2_9RHOB
MAARRARRGARAYQAGQAAEAAVERHYDRAGHPVAARRWRGAGGEIDLVLRDGEGLIFVEVKTSRDFARAAERVSPRQLARIQAAATEFMAREPAGQNTLARVDVALVDGAGRIDILENVMAA